MRPHSVVPVVDNVSIAAERAGGVVPSTAPGTIRNMPNDPETTHYYVRGTDPATNEQIAFECIGLAAASAKAAWLRMGRYKDVVMSVAKASQDDEPV
jgi:hypothetical protein